MTSNLPDAAVAEAPMSEDAIDSALAESFPASDPPCWTLGSGDAADKLPPGEEVPTPADSH